MRQKAEIFLPIDEAMDNLGTIVSIDLNGPPPIGIVQGKKFVLNPEEIDPRGIELIESEGADELLVLLDRTYQSVQHHLFELMGSSVDLKNPQTRRGIAAMMSLVGESAKKLDAYLAYRLGEEPIVKIEKRPAYKQLRQYYLENFAKQIEGQVAWDKQLGEDSQRDQPYEIKNLDLLLQDRDYELFLLVDQDGKPYFSEHLLRNLKLTSDFDLNIDDFEEDPFLKIRAIQDRDYRASAAQILHLCMDEIASFYKEVHSLRKSVIGKYLSQAILALYLAANPKFLLQRATGKTCTKYFEDFQLFLREALESEEYQKWVAYPALKAKNEVKILLSLAHKLCYGFFYRSESVKQEAIGMVHRVIRKGEELHTYPEGNVDTVWSRLLLDDEKLRALFVKYPNGPIFKTLDLVRHAEDRGAIASFNPFSQGNIPCQMYKIEKGGKEIALLHLPTPTHQTFIHRAEINKEFCGYIRYLEANSHLKGHLLINLQDRLSWKEMARSHCLESVKKDGLTVFTLPKHTEFYQQTGEYSQMESAAEFLKTFEGQLKSAEASGYFFPPEWNQNTVMKFAVQTLKLIHECIFGKAKKLNRQEREDFIELFHMMLVLWAIDQAEPSSMSFTCKDGVDTGAFSAGLLYGMLRLLRGELEGRERIDFLRYLFYWPALSLRERAVHAEGFHRTLSALERFGSALKKEGKKLLTALDQGYRFLG